MSVQGHGGPWQIVLAVVVISILAYAVLTGAILLGIFASTIIVLGYHFARLFIELIQLFRRLVVALEEIAENTR